MSLIYAKYFDRNGTVYGIAFLVYGLLCIFSEHMREEFLRYGLPKFRALIGILEILGGAGLLLGLYNYSLLKFSAFGLTCLMIAGVYIRIRVKDPLLLTLPALMLLVINATILYLVFS